MANRSTVGLAKRQALPKGRLAKMQADVSRVSAFCFSI